MKKIANRILVLFLITALILTFGILFTACGEENTEPTAATIATVAPTAAPTVAPTKAQPTVADEDEEDEDDDEDEEDEDQPEGYMNRADAIAEVRSQAGSGAEILSVYAGYSPDGYNAWVITVAPVTSSSDAVTVTYYVSEYFCYADTESSGVETGESYAGVDREDAKQTALDYMGAPYTYVDMYPGYTPEGDAAWVVILRCEAGAGDKLIDFYVGPNFAYTEDV